ncbi:hypothetical protein GH714_001000 [Hevea brasiliensis]|uniref:FAS1 domain-containing protein n=1 Tax=Hevea brasiliensis TaxID=3981 RepID=A0A6A6M6A0_HEVBR|nr:hypothetical protein GH714_001000 [Hevea brasiliensis]
MASKSSLFSYLPLFLLVVFIQLSPALQLDTHVPEYFNRFFPGRTTTNYENYVPVNVDDIAEALWNAGYKIMSLILQRNLVGGIVPYSFLFFAHYSDGRDMVKFYNKTITIFAPRDEAVPIEDWMALGNQIVRYKVDDESFRSGSFKEGSVLHTLNSHALEVTQVPWMGYPSINNVTITQWNIYNDGHVIVHGVEDFFPVIDKVSTLPSIRPFYDPRLFQCLKSEEVCVIKKDPTDIGTLRHDQAEQQYNEGHVIVHES